MICNTEKRHLLAASQPDAAYNVFVWQARCGAVLEDWERLHASLDDVSPFFTLSLCLPCLKDLNTPHAWSLYHTIVQRGFA